MPESLAAVGTYFLAGDGAAATMTAAAASDVGGGAIAAGVGTAGLSGAGALTGSALAGAAATSAASALASGVTTRLLQPKKPGVAPVTPMPDAQAQEQARKTSIAEQMARRGRASTVLTDPSAGTLGG